MQTCVCLLCVPQTCVFAVRMKLSLVIGGYHAMQRGEALCSIRSELSIARWSCVLCARSYSTYTAAKHQPIVVDGRTIHIMLPTDFA